ncbi:MAG: TM2 domain-containing protein [Lentisphaeria bacterium]|nr:TM2 domain-containing protein [Lentisphaeria bacterium]
MSEIFCPHCNQKYEVDESDFGECVSCNICKNSFVITLPSVVQKTNHPESQQSKTQRTCPMCGEAILDVAKICRHCRSILPDSKGNVSIRNTDYILLAIFLGWFGAHNFAANQFIRGMIQIIALIFALILFVTQELASVSVFIALKSLMIVVDVVIGTEYK